MANLKNRRFSASVRVNLVRVISQLHGEFGKSIERIMDINFRIRVLMWPNYSAMLYVFCVGNVILLKLKFNQNEIFAGLRKALRIITRN